MTTANVEQIPIPKFYSGRLILVTGGTGFIGKILVEKILRSCPDVAAVYLLLREKKGVSPTDRIKSITKVELFNELRKRNPTFEEKLHVVSGDLSLPNLGLSAKDRQFLVQNISVVLHVAASVRFDDPLPKAILLNVRGTRDLALMASEMPNLAVFLHVSTTYCNVDRKVIDEKLYPPHGNWRNLIAAAEKLDSSTIETLTPKLVTTGFTSSGSKLKYLLPRDKTKNIHRKILGVLPNTYTFSKSVAEHCLHDVLKGKPFVIVRPSIVISTFLEPMKGWLDNFNGPVGLMVACGKGLIHINVGRAENISDYMPADLVVRVILVAAYRRGINRTMEDPPPIYNCSSAVVKPVTMGEIREMGRKVNADFPLNGMLWEPLGLLTKRRSVFLIGTLVLHMIPALIIDAVLRFSGRKPRLVVLQRRIYAAQLALAYFLLNTWIFKNDKGVLLDKSIPEQDFKEFKFDYRDHDVYDYFRMVAIGGRRYLLKESDESLPEARKHRLRMIIINRVFLTMIFAWLLYITPYVKIANMLMYPVNYLFDIESI